ncbi:hypothetical protein KDW_51300 [Dictyobacter vulcani]|uniref:Uncharacterized protein n=1 Tax=Dictyobacter vulcani TaxID=2607529 RepID=A0A5J4KMM7_9CHLR|nr:hypothetical protein [Dictyobacter vulcani]GER90968.1 hypothetical protein KDW_51300 [Dictyobacter vulcani]
MQALQKCGITIKQYGKFHVREIRSAADQKPAGILQISLEQQDEEELFIGYVPTNNSNLPFILQRIRFWIMEQQSQLNQVDQWISDTFDAKTLEKLKELNAILEIRHKEVQQALNEIDLTNQTG